MSGPTVDDVARQLVGATDGNVGYLLAGQWVIQRLNEVATTHRLRCLRQVGQVYVPAAITTGLATFTRDSDQVTGDAQAKAAWDTAAYAGTADGVPGSKGIVGRHIRCQTSWYEILDYKTVGGVGTITLKNRFTEDSSSAGSYHIVQRFVPLDPRSGQIGKDFVHMRRRIPFKRVSMDELDWMFPARPRVGYGADQCAEAPELPDGTKCVEFYPYSTLSESYFYVYWQRLYDLKQLDPIPPRIPIYALKEAALIDLYRYKMSQALTEGKTEVAATWANMHKAQETKWGNEYMRHIVKADRGDDDATFLLRYAGIQVRSFDIQTAHDEIFSRWPR